MLWGAVIHSIGSISRVLSGAPQVQAYNDIEDASVEISSDDDAVAPSPERVTPSPGDEQACEGTQISMAHV